jgi:hypothetical protein
MDSVSATRPYPEPLGPPADVLARPPWMRRHPVAVDACVLIPDVLRRTRADFSALTFVGEQKLAALVAPTHIDAKVREHLPEVAARKGCSVELAIHVWETVHRPLIRFVDLPSELPRDQRVAAVAQRDDEDGPLAHLAVLLAPCVVLTGDGDLTRHGIGQDDWLATILLLKRLSELDAALWGGSRFAGLALYLPALAVGSAGRFLLQSELALGATIGMAIGAVLYLRPELRAAGASAWARVGPVLERAAELVAQGIELRAQADAALQPRLVTATAPPTVEQAAARLLAERWEPVSSVDIHAELVRRGHEGSLAATRALLREHPSFVPVPGRGFQLGRSFGAH